MRRYNTRFIFFTTKSLKQEIKKRSKVLDISMSDYIRTLIKQDIMINKISNTNSNLNQDVKNLNNFNKKLSGQLKELE